MHKPSITVIWFKRDLRLNDHAPLVEAQKKGVTVLLLYVFEPSVIQHADSDIRHWRFVWESLMDMKKQLLDFQLPLQICYGGVVAVMEKLLAFYHLQSVYSYQETGNLVTYKRDLKVASFCKLHSISWKEWACNGIVRGRINKKHWHDHWESTMQMPISEVHLEEITAVDSAISSFFNVPDELLNQLRTTKPGFQHGGESYAKRYLATFFQGRVVNYQKHISKPTEARKSCSRLSPYLAYGNLSIKQVYQASLVAIHNKVALKRTVEQFQSRLTWHCYFIQKLESNYRMEFENVNYSFNQLRNEGNEVYIAAWKEGKTGFPLIDACMLCVCSTGYLNFRMRSMLVSFFTHHLMQPWQLGVHHLAQMFLDYEPGIHYAQFQMQAGTTANPVIRMYNPIKQSKDHDPDGVFIKQWLPALALVPSPLIHEPWLMTPVEEKMYQCVLGQDYPKPIIDLMESGKQARKILWDVKKKSTK